MHAEATGVDAPWWVVANAGGRFNKVVFSEDRATAAGWYVYLREPMAAPAIV